MNEQGSLLERVLMDGHNVLLQVLEFTIMYIPIESQFYGVLCNGAQMANNPCWCLHTFPLLNGCLNKNSLV